MATAVYSSLLRVDIREEVRDEVKLLAILGVLSRDEVREVRRGGPGHWGRLLRVMLFGEHEDHCETFIEVVNDVVTKHCNHQ